MEIGLDLRSNVSTFLFKPSVNHKYHKDTMVLEEMAAVLRAPNQFCVFVLQCLKLILYIMFMPPYLMKIASGYQNSNYSPPTGRKVIFNESDATQGAHRGTPLFPKPRTTPTPSSSCTL
jgi:hypothetical protein